jgi:acetyl-CoA acetyltransferase
MAMTAEKLGDKYGITRAETDDFTFQSLSRWKKGRCELQEFLKLAILAYESGYFKEEIVPIKVRTRNGEIIFEKDERARDITLEKLRKIPPAFRKNGLITVASASGISDGASASIVAGKEAVDEFGLNPLVRIVGWKLVGCDPEIMGIGPVEAIRGLLNDHKLTLNDIDLIEVRLNLYFISHFSR